MKYLFGFLLLGLMTSCSQNRYLIDQTNLDDYPKILLLKSTSKAVTGVVYDEYENGQLEYEGGFKDGKKDGIQREWFENGQLKVELNWKEDTRDGLQRTWYENGRLVIEANYKEGAPRGLVRTWYGNGQLEYEANHKAYGFDGILRRWYENGQLKLEQHYNEGKRISEKCWDLDGNEIECK
mgnify:CR=1 FL=1